MPYNSIKGVNDINSVNIVGRWTKDVELKFTANKGTAIVRGSIAVPYYSNGEAKADFFNIVIFGKNAENVASYNGFKGNQIAITGELKSDKYEKDGKTHYLTYVRADKVRFLNSKKTDAQQEQQQEDGNIFEGEPVYDGDMPF